VSSSAAAVLAASDTGKGSPIGLFVVLLLVIAVYLLYRSMTGHLRRLPEKFPDYEAAAGADEVAQPADPDGVASTDDGAQPGSPAGPKGERPSPRVPPRRQPPNAPRTGPS
jgi:hypothetical protein